MLDSGHHFLDHRHEIATVRWRFHQISLAWFLRFAIELEHGFDQVLGHRVIDQPALMEADQGIEGVRFAEAANMLLRDLTARPEKQLCKKNTLTCMILAKSVVPDLAALLKYTTGPFGSGRSFSAKRQKTL